MPHIARMVCSVLVLVLLAACGGAPTPASDAPPATEETEANPDTETATTADDETETSDATTDERGTLRMAHEIFWGGAESFDPSSAVFFYTALRMVYDTLTRPDENYEPAPSLATAWEPNEDATVWTFTLRDDVFFHDGTPFTSTDVAYTFERLLSPESESVIGEVLSLIEEIDTPDEQTVVFTLNQPHAELPVLFMQFSTSIIPADSSETIGTTGIGTGPFKLETLDIEGTTYLVANDDYWQGTPGVAAIELIGIADSDARLRAFQAGQLDLLIDLSAQQAQTLANSDNIIVERYSTGSWYGIEMRTDTPPFDDARVRKAMRLVADRQEMIDLVLQGEGTLSCDTIVWPGDPHRWEGDCTQDIAQARALLDEAGYPDGLDVTLYTSDSLPPMVPLAEVYQQQAAEAGINVTIEQVPSDSFWGEVWGVEPLVVTSDGIASADFALNQYFRAASSYNATRLDNPEVEALIDTARATLDPTERTQRYQAVQALLFEEGGTLVPLHMIELRAFHNTVSGVAATPRYDMPWNEITKVEE